MALASYTSVEDIRAALGVSEDELPDSVILLTLYEDALALDISSLSETLDVAELYAETDQIPDEGKSIPEKRFLASFRIFCTYSVAAEAASGLPMFALKATSSEKQSGERAGTDFSKNAEIVKEKYAVKRADLLNALAGMGETVKTGYVPNLAMFSLVSYSSDPVTNT